MSDLVRYFSGNTIHRDHLQWPTILRAEIDTYIPGLTADQIDSAWPIDISLLQAMAIFWRVKKWKLTGSGVVQETVTVPGPIVDVYDGAFQFDADMVLTDQDQNEATTESDLVSFDTGAPFHSLANGGTIVIPGTHLCDWQDSVNGGSNESSSKNANQAGNAGMNFPAYIYTLFDSGTQLFSPSMFGPGLVLGGQGGNLMGVSLSPKRTPTSNLSGSGTGFLLAPVEMTIVTGITDDIIVPMQLAWRATFQPGTATYSGFGSVTDVQLEAMEFWPFKTSTGLPVYDSSSGAQINDPFA